MTHAVLDDALDHDPERGELLVGCVTGRTPTSRCVDASDRDARVALLTPPVRHRADPQARGARLERPPVAVVAVGPLAAHEHVEATVGAARDVGEVEGREALHHLRERHDRHLPRRAPLAGQPVGGAVVDRRAAVDGVGVRRTQVLVVAAARHERGMVDLTAHAVEVGVHDRAEQGDVDVGVDVTIPFYGSLVHGGDQPVARRTEPIHRVCPHRVLHGAGLYARWGYAKSPR